MAIELTKPIVSQASGIQKLDSKFSSNIYSQQELQSHSHWFNQILATPTNEPIKPILPGVENTLQKISSDFNKLERDALALTKKLNPVKMVMHTMEVSNTMFRVAIVTKLAGQCGRSLDKLTSLN